MLGRWITPAIHSLQQRVAPLLEFTYLPFRSVWQPFFYYAIQPTPSDAESHEEQDGSKHKFVGEMVAKLWPDLCQGITKNMENERFKPC